MIRLLFFVSLIAFASCNKKENGPAVCDPDAATVRTIVNQKAVVQLNVGSDPVRLVEENSIDAVLLPCELAPEFRQHGLQVVISGDVKATQSNSRPCCYNNIVLTKITR